MKIASKSAAPAAPVAPTQYVPLDNIVNKKELKYRALDSEHVDSIAASIIANGLDTPLTTFAEKADSMVRIKGAEEPVAATFLVAGNHRRAALMKVRRENADVFKKRFPNGIPVVHHVYTIPEAMFAQLRENIARKEMTAEEIFPVLEQLSSEPYNLSGKDIAKKIGKSTAWVSQHLAVNEELDDETKTEVNEGKIPVGAARKLASEVRAERKAGKTVSKEEIRSKAEAAKNKAASGAQRAQGEDRRVSLKKLFGRYTAVTTKLQLNVGRKLILLTNMVEYSLGQKTKLEPELRTDPAPSKVVAKSAKK